VQLLVLGGTDFLGRALVEAALERGDEVTTFTRGKTNPELFPEAERLRGDRDGDLRALEGRAWEAVVDLSGYVPRVVRASAELLEPSVARYVFVSSISVYADLSGPVSEEGPTATLDDPSGEDVAKHYGALKAACEREVERVFGDRSLIVRPGLIAGPHDPDGRFTYWPHRTSEGGDVLAPGPPERPAQLIDARDLGSWILRALDGGLAGIFNAVGTWSFGEVLAASAAASGTAARPVWVTDEFLLEQGVGEWMEVPLWIASDAYRGMMRADVSRAVAAGLTVRPLVETARAALHEAERAEGVGLTAEREAQLLAAWSARA
jgi:2'-hydroxyisoflavone reductase